MLGFLLAVKQDVGWHLFDSFLSPTCNPAWPEHALRQSLIYGQSVQMFDTGRTGRTTKRRLKVSDLFAEPLNLTLSCFCLNYKSLLWTFWGWCLETSRCAFPNMPLCKGLVGTKSCNECPNLHWFTSNVKSAGAGRVAEGLFKFGIMDELDELRKGEVAGRIGEGEEVQSRVDRPADQISRQNQELFCELAAAKEALKMREQTDTALHSPRTPQRQKASQSPSFSDRSPGMPGTDSSDGSDATLPPLPDWATKGKVKSPSMEGQEKQCPDHEDGNHRHQTRWPKRHRSTFHLPSIFHRPHRQRGGELSIDARARRVWNRRRIWIKLVWGLRETPRGDFCWGDFGPNGPDGVWVWHWPGPHQLGLCNGSEGLLSEWRFAEGALHLPGDERGFVALRRVGVQYFAGRLHRGVRRESRLWPL